MNTSQAKLLVDSRSNHGECPYWDAALERLLWVDMMGFKKEELLDGVEYEGVAAYLAEADEANVNLFI